MKITNELPSDYNSPYTIMVVGDTGACSIEGLDRKLLNGYDSQDDFTEYMNKDMKAKVKPGSYMTFLFNEADQKLYTVVKYISGKMMSEKEMNDLAEYTQSQWSDGIGEGYEQMPITEFDGEECFLSPWHKDQEMFISVLPIQIPAGHYWLGSIFDTPEKQMMYEEFMTDPVMYERFKRMCEVAKLNVTDEMITTTSLPIHKRDRHTGELLISEKVFNTFQQFQYAQNFLHGFEKGTPENDLGKVLMLAPKFCEYMIDRAKYIAEGKEPHNDEEKYFLELNKAIKFIESRSNLLSFYENDLQYPEKIEG